ncbi:hypothetical protein AAIB33_17820 [Microbacterium sp. AZCO]|uniref:DUF7507 domain-containing protein n=1 Tax=Microbacterium sp. AZCO TaxID=3142976 RepID=UPI0031F359EF
MPSIARLRAKGWVGALAAAALITAALVSPVVVSTPALATTPGSPGTPQPPTPLFTEDFSARSASAAAIGIETYQGAPGTAYVPGSSGASSETYYADPNWRMAARLCNGFILNGSTPVVTGDPCAGNATGLGYLKQITQYIGRFQGMTTTAANSNQALAAWTWNSPNPGAGVQFQTNAPITAVDGHFYRVTAVFGEANCTAGDALERLSLIVNGTLQTLATNLDPCNAPGSVVFTPPIQNANLQTKVASLTTPALKVKSASAGVPPTLGMQLYNAQGTGSGNDVVFDLPQIMDVTPQLDKAFSPSTIASGQTSTLTFTITNTNELGLKDGIGFRDNLPSGVTATGLNSTTCTNGTVTAAAGATTAVLTGARLNLNQNSCTVTVQVTATTPGTYVNGPANFPAGVAGLDGVNPPADTTLTVTAPASLNLTKSTTTEAITTVGQVVTYRFRLTNNGPTTVSNIVVTDTQVPPASQANMSAIRCETTTLAPDASTTCVGTYTVSQADVTAGSVTDRATATATNPTGGAVTAPEVTLTLTSPQPSISIVKSTTTTLVNTVGQQVPYAFRVTNTGNVTLLNVGVTDTQTPPATQGGLSAITCPETSLAPGAAETCTATYTATLADLVNRSISDSATASGTTNAGTTVNSQPSTLSVPSEPPGSLSIVKTTTTAAVTAVGQSIPYTFTVTNNSSFTLTSVGVTDTVEAPSLPANLSAITCQSLSNPVATCSGATATLAAGQVATFAGTYQTTQADVNQGRVADSAISTGRDASNNLVQSGPSRVVLNAPISALTIAKATAVTSVSAVGQQVPYTFTVTNTGNQPLTAVRVDDTQVVPASQAGMSAVTCQSLANPVATCSGTATALAAGQVATFTGTYTVTQADLNNGSVNDFAVAVGTNPSNATITSPQSSATVNASTTPLSMVKSVAEDVYRTIGQSVHYTFRVTNNSATVYRNLQIQDTQVAPAVQENLSNVSCAQTILQAGESTTCSATYTVTAADITNGTLSDFATATGIDVGGNTATTARSSTIIPAQQEPSISLTKSSTVAQITSAGQQVPYTFTVRNTGNVTVTGVQVTDTQTPPASQGNMSAVACPPGDLDPGSILTCTGTYTVTQADLDNGLLHDSAIAHATAPSGATIDSLEAELTVTANPALEVVKSSSTTQITTVGQQVPYTFTVRNIRASAVSNIQVTDTPAPPSLQSSMSAIVCDATTLAAGGSTTCRGTYSATAADIANGTVDDSATASGTDSTGLPLPPSTPSAYSIPTVAAPELTIDKSSNTSVITQLGQVVSYRFVVTNTGNVTLSDIDVVDTPTPPASAAGLSPMSCPYPTLDPGESETCSASYTVTQADLDNRAVADSAVATSTAPDGSAVQSQPDALSIPAPATAPALSIVKTSTLTGIVSLNQQIPYTFVVTNNGATTLTNVRVDDTQIAPAVQANLSSVICRALTSPAATCSGTTATLAPGQSARFTANYTTTQPDFDNGRVDDSAVAVGTSGGSQVTSSPSAWSVPVDPVSPLLTVTKSSTTTVATAVGQQVPYVFHVTNTGNQTLTDISVTDVVASPSIQTNLSAITCPPGSLAPGAFVECDATYTATTADLNSRGVVDTAVAHGTTPAGRVTDSNAARVSIPTAQTPGIQLGKASTTSAVTAAGQQVPYTFTVTNSGNVALTGVSVTDTVTPPSDPANLSAVTCVALSNPADSCSGPTAALAAGQVATFTATYTATQADVDSGSVKDSAVAHGTPPGADAPLDSAQADLAILAPAAPRLSVVKSSSTPAATAAGQRIPYTFTVTNTGNVTLSAISITDTVAPPSDPANLSTVTCPPGDLAPGLSADCTATYTTTQADMDNGGAVTDSAVAHGTAPGATAPTDSVEDRFDVPVTQTPGISVVKSSATSTVTGAGQQVPYTFTVTNTGNVTLTEVAVTDTVTPPSDPAGLTPVTCVSLASPAAACSGLTATLVPGQVATFTATYTTTQADVDSGSVNDAATAAGLPPGSTTPFTSTQSSASIAAPEAPKLTVVKESTTFSVDGPGQVVPYSFTVTNTGNVTLSQVSVTDTVTPPSDPVNLSAVTCVSLSNPAASCAGASTSLVPGQVATFAASYTSSEADMDAGWVRDSAVAHGTSPGNVVVGSSASPHEIPAPAIPGLSLVKATTTSAVTAAGQQVPYTFTVTNTGNVTIAGVQVTDSVTGDSDPANLSEVTCVALSNPVAPCSGATATLAYGQVATFTATYTVTQADVDSGSVNDTSVAAGVSVADQDVESNTSDVSVPVTQAGSLELVKSSTTTSITAAGQKVPYAFTVTNTGNVTLTGIGVTDTVAAPSDPAGLSPVVCPAGPLAPAAQMVCTATYTVSQADVDAGGALRDAAVAHGSPPTGPKADSPESGLDIPVSQSPHLTVVKSTSSTAVSRVAQEIRYTFTVTNDGNVTMTDVSVSDAVRAPSDPANLTRETCVELESPAADCPDAPITLLPGQTVTFTASYTTTAADLAEGTVADGATATGTPPATADNPAPAPWTTPTPSVVSLPVLQPAGPPKLPVVSG